MTRKDFEAIAAILKNRREWGGNSTIDFDQGYDFALEMVVDDLVEYFEGENPRFDRAKFITACGQ